MTGVDVNDNWYLSVCPWADNKPNNKAKGRVFGCYLPGPRNAKASFTYYLLIRANNRQSVEIILNLQCTDCSELRVSLQVGNTGSPLASFRFCVQHGRFVNLGAHTASCCCCFLFSISTKGPTSAAKSTWQTKDLSTTMMMLFTKLWTILLILPAWSRHLWQDATHLSAFPADNLMKLLCVNFSTANEPQKQKQKKVFWNSKRPQFISSLA